MDKNQKNHITRTLNTKSGSTLTETPIHISLWRMMGSHNSSYEGVCSLDIQNAFVVGHNKTPTTFSSRTLLSFAQAILFTLLMSVSNAVLSQNSAVTVAIDESCAANRVGSALNCTAGEFTEQVLSNAVDTEPFC
ncbi:MAG: hypothetical protein P8Z33_14830, partial [Gammaproteobacteria bacterium]